MQNNELIDLAKKIAVKMELSSDASAGGVGAALLTDKRNVYEGVCIDTKCSMGFCAEHNAVGNMITHAEKNIEKIVAVNFEGKIYPPCGRCREFMYQISDYNKDTKVILAVDETKLLRELLPNHWRS